MRKIFLSLFALFSLVSTVFSAQERLTTSAYDVIKVTLDGTHKMVVNAVQNGQSPKSVKTLMDEVGGVSAINGAFFDAYSKYQSSDMIAIWNGQKRSKYGDDLGDTRALFGFTKEGTADLASNATRSRNNGSWYNSDFSKFQYALAMHALIINGRNVSASNSEMNNDGKQGKAGTKEFICSTSDGKTVYFGRIYNVNFRGLADAVQNNFNCYNAIMLDAGGSTAIYFEGEKIAGPGRNVMDAFVVIEDDSAYQEELQESIIWMYDHGMTRYNDPDSFMAKNSINREQASKFFGVLAENIFDKDEEINSDATCTFSDLTTADQTLTENIVQSCKIGLFNGYNGKFDPKAKLTNAQALAVLTRIVRAKLDETQNPWYQHYYGRDNLSDWISAEGLKVAQWSKVDGEANRGELAVMFYRTAKLLDAENGVSSSSKAKKKEEKSESDEKTNENEEAECLSTVHGYEVTSKETVYKAGLIGDSFVSRAPSAPWSKYSRTFFHLDEKNNDQNFCVNGFLAAMGCRDNQCRWICTMDTEHDSDTARYCTVEVDDFDDDKSVEEIGRETTDSHDVLVVQLGGDYEVIVNAVQNGQSPKSVKNLMEEVNGVAAINGAFFDAYNTKTSDMIALWNGKKRSVYGDDLGETRAMFGFSEDGTPILATNSTRYWDNATNGWVNSEFSKMKYGLSMYTLIDHGRDVSANNTQMNNDAKQGQAGTKQFICSTQDNEKIYFGKVHNVSFMGLAQYIQQHFDCYNAIQLDAGGSAAMYFDGEEITAPGRDVMDAFVVVKK